MTTKTETASEPRTPLSRERILSAAVQLADEGGIEAVSMRKVGLELGVEAMSLYNHVANKEEILDGMVDIVVSEIEMTATDVDWKTSVRDRILSARAAMARHPWAPSIIESRVNMTPPMMSYMDAFCGIFLDNGFSMDLTHHALHAIGSRMLGFNQELFDDSEALEQSPEVKALMLQQMADVYPNIHRLMIEITHDDDSIIGTGCDDDVEFVFSLDLILDGLEAMRAAETA